MDPSLRFARSLALSFSSSPSFTQVSLSAKMFIIETDNVEIPLFSIKNVLYKPLNFEFINTV